MRARYVAGAPLSVMVLEGGWPSAAVGAVASTPATQVDYIRRHAGLLAVTDSRGVSQITFTDVDLAELPPELAPFAHNGLVDTDVQAKPALAAWDEVFRT